MLFYSKKLFTWQKQTVGRDLMVRLMWVLSFGVILTAALNYYYSVNRDRKNLRNRANEVMNNVTNIVTTPMWNTDAKEMKRIAENYSQYDFITNVYIVNEDGDYEVKPGKGQNISTDFSLNRQITYEGEPIGSIYMEFTYQPDEVKQLRVLISTLFVFFLVILLLIITIKILMKRFLAVHLARLANGLETIAGGDYSYRINQAQHADLNQIGNMVNTVAFEINRREKKLVKNQDRLEVLNKSILQIFSCSSFDELVRKSLSVLMEVSQAKMSWFMIEEDFNLNSFFTKIEDKYYIYKDEFAIKCSSGDIQKELGANGSTKLYSIPVNFKSEVFARITIVFNEDQDQTIESLLKSLSSLISMALEKQAFIHESVMISAEIEVAETIQQSVLPDQYSKIQCADVNFYLKPVLRVGGDWFSIIESKDGRFLYLILADVTGHGIAQGLVTTAVAGSVHNIESRIKSSSLKDQMISPSEIITQFDSLIEKIAGKSNLNMTCVIARFDFSENKLVFCNAGHRHPFILGQNSKTCVQTLIGKQGEILGTNVSSSSKNLYQDNTVDFTDNSKFIFYTDGLLEAENLKGKQFMRKFNRQLKKMDGSLGAKETLQSILRQFNSHTQQVIPNDDVCLVVVSKKDKNESSKLKPVA